MFGQQSQAQPGTAAGALEADGERAAAPASDDDEWHDAAESQQQQAFARSSNNSVSGPVPAGNGGDSPYATPRQGGSDGDLGADEGTPSPCSASSSGSHEGRAAADSAYFRVQPAEPNRSKSLELQGSSGSMGGISTLAAAAEAEPEAGRSGGGGGKLGWANGQGEVCTPQRLALAAASAGSAGAALERQPTAPAASFESPQQQQQRSSSSGGWQAAACSSRGLSVPLTGGLSAADRELLTPDKISIQGVEQPGEAEAGGCVDVPQCMLLLLACLRGCIC